MWHLKALLVTFLWSTSWILIKIGLDDLPPLVFAGLRYLLASIVLLVALLKTPSGSRELRRLDRRSWLLLVGLGLVMYSLTQGAQFVALGQIPAVMVNLVLTFTPAFVALLSIWFLGEPPTGLQWLGMLVLLAGALLYLDFAWPEGRHLYGFGVAILGMLANGGAALLGRYVNRSGRHRPLLVTAVSMTVGSIVLFSAGMIIEGLPTLDLESWLIILWLAVVNTAFAFTLWNHTLGRLTATESSVINNTMLIQVAIMAWLFLGEGLTGRQVAAVLIAALGALIVQLRPGRSDARSRPRAASRADPGTAPAPD